MSKFDVIGVGLSAMDYLGIVDEYPPPADVKICMSEFTKQGGGPVATALVALSRLGIKTAFVGKMGDDESGVFMLKSLKDEGVDVSHVVIEKGASSPPAFIVVDRNSGSRNIFWSESNISPLQPSEISHDFIKSCRILHLDGLQMQAGIEAAKVAREAGITVILDGDTIRPGIDEMISLTDVIVASYNFAVNFTGESSLKEAMIKLNSMGPKTVGVTLGEKGCIFLENGNEISIPAFPVEIVDTTGAGDVFHGAFIYGLLQEWPLDKIAEFSNAVSAIKCRKLGGRAGIPSLNEVKIFLGWNW
ncbi:hypothetical protein GF312_07550 [Candidatus Poribacteria bacterium]|nr:hypothetical protein [Candidatus Poribacteria bacterium]